LLRFGFSRCRRCRCCVLISSVPPTTFSFYFIVQGNWLLVLLWLLLRNQFALPNFIFIFWWGWLEERWRDRF
jgi:hypothetical protein